MDQTGDVIRDVIGDEIREPFSGFESQVLAYQVLASPNLNHNMRFVWETGLTFIS